MGKKATYLNNMKKFNANVKNQKMMQDQWALLDI